MLLHEDAQVRPMSAIKSDGDAQDWDRLFRSFVKVSWTGIVSQRWERCTFALHVSTNLTPEHYGEPFLDVIQRSSPRNQVVVATLIAPPDAFDPNPDRVRLIVLAYIRGGGREFTKMSIRRALIAVALLLWADAAYARGIAGAHRQRRRRTRCAHPRQSA
jgi:hypothetical protein